MKKTKLEDRVLGKIKKDKVKMKPKIWFMAQEWGLKSFVGIAMVGVGLLLLTMGYMLDVNSSWGLLDFGDLGWELFLQDFPFVFLLGSIGLLIVAVVGFGKVGENYKRAKLTLLGIVLGAVLIITLLLWQVKSIVF